MRFLITAVLLSIACLAFVGCVGIDEEEWREESEDLYPEYVTVINGEKETGDPQEWGIYYRYQFGHKYWKQTNWSNMMFHGNACDDWQPDWKPYGEAEGKEIRSHVIGKSEHRYRHFETDIELYDKETGKPLHVHCTDFGKDKATKDYIYEVDVNYNQRARWRIPYWLEFKNDEFWIHANSCPTGWKNYWKPFTPQAMKWLEIRNQVWEYERYPWRVEEGWTMEQKMRMDGRRVHIHCGRPQNREGAW